MYKLPHYSETDETELVRFINEHPFALVAGVDDEGKPIATQVPLLLEKREGTIFLFGHLMKQTDHHLAFLQNPNTLCVFTGPHTYISATWYANPHQASTWNYQSVQVKGRLRFVDDAGLLDILQKTTLYFEKYNSESTTVLQNLPADYTSRLTKAIAGFEIEVQQMEGVFKLSQNRDRDSYRNIISHLSEGDADAKMIAAEMKHREKPLFERPPVS